MTDAPAEHAAAHRVPHRTEERVIHAAYFSSALYALLMVGALWVRPALEWAFTDVLRDAVTRGWAISCFMFGSAWAIASVYRDIQIAQILARQVTNASQDEADFWLSLIPVLVMVGIVVLWSVDRIHIAWAEWFILWLFAKEAIMDLGVERWISKRLTLRVVGVDPFAGR